jgi:hypothetical protein
MNAELEKWMDVWEKAQKKGIFEDEPKAPVVNQQVYSSDYFGNVRVKEGEKNVTLNECDTKYWNQIYRLSRHQGDTPDLLSEQAVKIKDDPLGSEAQGKVRDTPTKDELGTKGAELGNTANPVYPDSRGEDQRKKVTPDWADGDGLRELVDMKHMLYKLETKINAHPKFGAYGAESPEIKKIQTQIDELRHKMDLLSNDLSPNFIKDELS